VDRAGFGLVWVQIHTKFQSVAERAINAQITKQNVLSGIRRADWFVGG